MPYSGPQKKIPIIFLFIDPVAGVKEVFDKHRHEFGVKREPGARQMRKGEWDGLCTMRDLRLETVTVAR